MRSYHAGNFLNKIYKIIFMKTILLLPEIIFGFDKQRELKNWYETFTKIAQYGLGNGSNKWNVGDIPQEVQTIVVSSDSEKQIFKKIEILLNEFIKRPESMQIIQQATDRAKKRWNKVSMQYFTALSKMLDIPIENFEKKYYVFFTFGSRCPFGNNWFMFSKFNDFSNAAAHEIMHVEFLKKYKNHCLNNGLSNEQLSHFKEILTVLLNADMANILYHPDYGYEKHKIIRQEILELYQKVKKQNGNFILFLDKAINLVKNINF